MKGQSSVTAKCRYTSQSTKLHDNHCQPRDSLCIDHTFARGNAGGDAKTTFRHNRVVCDICDYDTNDACRAPSPNRAIPNTRRVPSPPKTIPNTHWRRHDPSLWQSDPSIPADARVHPSDWFQTEYGGAHAETKKTQNQERVHSYFTDVQTRSKVYGDYHYYDDGIHSGTTGKGDHKNKLTPIGPRYENTENWKYQEECKRAQKRIDTQRKNAIKPKTKIPELLGTRATNLITQGTIQELWPETKYPQRYSKTALNTMRKLGYKDRTTTVDTSVEAKKIGPKKKTNLPNSSTSFPTYTRERHSSNLSHKADTTSTSNDTGLYQSFDSQRPTAKAKRKFTKQKTLRRDALWSLVSGRDALEDVKRRQQQEHDSGLKPTEPLEGKSNVRFKSQYTLERYEESYTRKLEHECDKIRKIGMS